MKNATIKRDYFCSLLEKFARAVESLSDEQLEKLLDGRARLAVSVKENKSRATKKPRAKKIESAPIPPERFSALLPKIESAASREECRHLVADIFTQKDDMLAFAKFLHLPVQKKDGKDRIRDMIVEMTAGERLDGEVIRGGY